MSISVCGPPPVDTCPASCVPMGTAVFEVRYLCTGVAVFSLWHGRLGAVSMSIATLLVLQCTSTPVPRTAQGFHLLVDRSPASCALMRKTAFEVSALEWLCLACGVTGQGQAAQRQGSSGSTVRLMWLPMEAPHTMWWLACWPGKHNML